MKTGHLERHDVTKFNLDHLDGSLSQERAEGATARRQESLVYVQLWGGN